MNIKLNLSKVFQSYRVILLCAICSASQLSLAQQPAAVNNNVPAAAQAPGSAAAAQVPAVAQSQDSSEPQSLHLLVGRSLVITSPNRIKRVSLADPDIAEAIVVSPTQVLVNGRKPGGVSLLLWDETDQSQAFEVSVDIDVLSLSQKIHEVFPAENVHIDTSKDSVILTGKISSAAVADKILEVVKGATPKVTSMMEVPVVVTPQVLLHVRFAEVDRSAVDQFGINFISLPGAKNVGVVGTQQFV
jgi:pilus assembly protein CpaC